MILSRLTLLIASVLWITLMGGCATSKAGNLPCSGSKGGIARCEGSKFICNDGSNSQSKKDCSVVFSGFGSSTQSLVQPENAKIPKQSIKNRNVALTRASEILKLDYEGFTIWLDCSRRGAVKFRYNAQRDSGSSKRYDNFFLDPNVPAECQQTSVRPYGRNYDRGHQVPANHLDSSEAAIKATNTMINILPQAANMNRGAWLQTEEIIECYRDIDELLIIGGVVWGNNPADDYFFQSHGVATPDAFWKVVIRGTGQDERAIAWIIPNSQEAIKKNTDKYLVSVAEIEKLTGERIPVADYAKQDKSSESWIIPSGCNKG